MDFLEGDPDRPFVGGPFYSGSNMPLYSLPDNNAAESKEVCQPCQQCCPFSRHNIGFSRGGKREEKYPGDSIVDKKPGSAIFCDSE